MPMEREYPWMVLINAPSDFLRCLLKLVPQEEESSKDGLRLPEKVADV